MSNTTSADTKGAKGGAAAGQKPVTVWQDFDTDRELVSFERCEQAGIDFTDPDDPNGAGKGKRGTGKPIQGWVLGEERIKEADAEKEMPAFDCVIMKLTAPCVLANKDGEKYDVPTGTMVLVPKLARLGSVADVGNHPVKVYEMKISPTEKVKLTGVKKMQKFKCRINPAHGIREIIAPATMARFNLTAPAAAPALPPAPFE